MPEAVVKTLENEVKNTTQGNLNIHVEEDDNVKQVNLVSYGDELHLEVNVADNEVIVASQIECQTIKQFKGLLKACKKAGYICGFGSVFAPSAQKAPTAWEKTDFRRQYIKFLRNARPRKDQVDNLTQDKKDNLCEKMEHYIGYPVQCKVSLDERPYIISIDFKSEGLFKCYLHFHELTKAVYIEEIELKKEMRGNGIGSAVVPIIIKIADDLGFKYIYLLAKEKAEIFWQKQGFNYVYRSNLRQIRRRKASIKRKPGWQSTWFNGKRLDYPFWVYRNHPQDDCDLWKAIKIVSGLVLEKS